MEKCTHESLSGVDQAPLDGPTKAWRCDGCDELIVNDGMTAVKVGRVCVVTEVRKLDGSESLYGVWETEEMARRDYGIEDERYSVRFDVVPMWGFRLV